MLQILDGGVLLDGLLMREKRCLQFVPELGSGLAEHASDFYEGGG
jgi:hypothetical protein